MSPQPRAHERGSRGRVWQVEWALCETWGRPKSLLRYFPKSRKSTYFNEIFHDQSRLICISHPSDKPLGQHGPFLIGVACRCFVRMASRYRSWRWWRTCDAVDSREPDRFTLVLYPVAFTGWMRCISRQGRPAAPLLDFTASASGVGGGRYRPYTRQDRALIPRSVAQ